MKVGDKVKVDRIGGFYSIYGEWAEAVGAERWVYNKYPKNMEFVIKAIAPHLTDSVALYLLSNNEGEFIFDNISSSIIPVKGTRTEYEKVTESIFDLRDEFERGELYFDRDRCTGGIYVSSDQYQKIRDMNDFSQAALNNNIYRKVEKEIDWHEEADNYFLKTKYLGIDCTIEEAITRSDYCDEFLELCRVALRANGEIE